MRSHDEEVRMIRGRLTEERKGFVKALRRLSSLMERNPELPDITGYWDYGDKEFVISLDSYRMGDEEAVRERMQEIVRVLRRSFSQVEKDYSGSYFELKVPLSETHVLVVRCDREEVCERRVVGTRLETVPKYETVQRGTETKLVEDVEWDCEPILGSV